MSANGGGHHAVLLRGPSFGGTRRSAPLLLHRTEDEFVPAVLAELSNERTIPTLLRSVASRTDKNQRLKLFQPVQRAFHIALVEIVCDRPEYPRFDAANVVSAGLVVRRVHREQVVATKNGKGSSVGVMRDRYDLPEGWRQEGAIVQGWVPFATRAEENLDPDPVFRRLPRYGHAEVDARLAGLQSPTARMSESFAPLFPAPPEVARALRKTIFFGVVPVTSSEVSKAPAGESFADQQVRERLSPYLRATMKLGVPGARRIISARDMAEAGTQNTLAAYTNMLRQLAFELDAFGDSPESKALFAALNRFSLGFGQLSNGREPRYTLPAGIALRQHAEVLVHRKENPTRLPGEAWHDYPKVMLPNTWPTLDVATGNAIAAAAKRVLDKRLPTIKGEEPRYGDNSRLYRVRAFARAAHDGECLRTVWTDYSDPFVIAPWYEGYGAPTTQVKLPGLDELVALAKKPNVTFAVPGDVAKMIQQNDPVELMKGNGKKGSGLSIEFLCSMSIPVITLCAFIMLNIVIGLLNLFLQWMMWPIMMCIPILKAASGPPEPAPPNA